jgi:hypothetical protein
LRAAPAATPLRIVGGSVEYQLGDLALAQSAEDLARWERWNDPRRAPEHQPEIALSQVGLKISGTGWPGVVKMFEATPGDRYLVRTKTSNTRDGDLLYLGTWQQPQVRSLSEAASSGMPAPLIALSWFPQDRAFIATAAQVRLLLYSEAAATDFTVSSLDVYRLRPVSGGARAEAAR